MQYSIPQHPHESYLLHSILFFSTKIGTRKYDASELSSNDRFGSDIIEAEVVEYNDLVDDKHGVGEY